MTSYSPQNTYHQNRIKTASQSELIVMLYDGAIRNLEAAIEELGATKPRMDIINNAFNKASNIVTELSAALNFQDGGEVASHLFNLYCFFNNEITSANIKKEVGNIPSIIEMLTDLRRTWKSISSEGSHQPSIPRAGLSING